LAIRECAYLDVTSTRLIEQERNFGSALAERLILWMLDDDYMRSRWNIIKPETTGGVDNGSL